MATYYGAEYGPKTGFNANGADLGSRFISKAYIIDNYPDVLPSKNMGGLFTWGDNTYGQLGLGNQTSRSSPVQVGMLTTWKQLAINNLSFGAIAIKTDGTLWTWGANGAGQLGLGDTSSRSSPVQVGSLTNWKQVSIGYATCAIKTDGTLWAWGDNGYGQLGLNDRTNRSSPVQVGSLTNWKQVSVGHDYISAIKTDGTLWTCGGNSGGQLGLNDRNNRSSPVQVGSLTNWKQVSSGSGANLFYKCTAGIKTDGTLWTWGYDPYQFGFLGQGSTVGVSSPVQVGALTNWNIVSSGDVHVGAVKTDGTLWTWGYNSNGQLGLNDRTNRSSPVQVGSLTNWKQISCSAALYYCTSIKTDGTIWGWGYNNLGQLGQGNITQVSSPVQVGSLTNWKQVSGSGAILDSKI